jgi:hypothetical protein
MPVARTVYTLAQLLGGRENLALSAAANLDHRPTAGQWSLLL